MRKLLTIIALASTPLLLGSSAVPVTPAPLVEELDKTVVNTEAIEPPVRYVDVDTLPTGIEITEKEGKPGELTFYVTQESFTNASGDSVEVPVYSEAVTLHPEEKVVVRGTNKEVVSGVSEKVIASEKAKSDAEAARLAAEEAEKARVAEEARRSSNSSNSSSSSNSSNSNSNNYVAPPVSSNSGGGMTSPAENRAYAQSILSASEFACADQLVMRESGWRTDAENSGSGAYGVPQSLPASKLASAGADWRTNGKTQFNWMVGYINDRYNGSFCNGLSHSHSVGWY